MTQWGLVSKSKRIYVGASIHDVRSGWGSPKNRLKEQNQLICDSDRGGERGVKNSENFADVMYGSPLDHEHLKPFNQGKLLIILYYKLQYNQYY